MAMEQITASEIAGFGVGTFLICATIAAPRIDGKPSIPFLCDFRFFVALSVVSRELYRESDSECDLVHIFDSMKLNLKRIEFEVCGLLDMSNE
ncbi:hypothetical protein HS088_TW15G01129 [Tripterygium wilfordii]|uniref:Uncharacterized protein n=1 Tax=Tripterygium wilfordii TaxID=458696 RepID=A0A7J7CNG9_TRIWF|nr:hypothetical protein HS088_TW15G01129 [Tripterygium wilfordii]